MKRFLFGKHPLDGSYGLWLSLPGIDVTTTTDRNSMLICPIAKNEQVMMSGVSAVASGASVDVLFPAALPSPPYAAFYFSPSASAIYYPFNTGSYDAGDALYLTSQNDRITLTNGCNRGMYFFYIVACRNMGS